MFLFQVHKLTLDAKTPQKVRTASACATFLLSLVPKDSPSSLKNHPLHPDHNSAAYLEGDPKGIDASSPIGQWRSLVPDVRQMFIAHEQVDDRISQRTLVLVAGHDEVIHNKWCKHEQEKDAGQGKPIYLPVTQNRTFLFPAFRQNAG